MTENQNHVAIDNLERVLRFAQNIHNSLPQQQFLTPIIRLEELLERIKKANKVFLRSDEIPGYFNPILDMIINLKPSLSNQLEMFWSAQKEIIHNIINSNDSLSYVPIKMIDKKMGQSIGIYNNILDKFEKTTYGNKAYLYALFYLHIMKTESVEYPLKSQFDAHLEYYGLGNSYDSNKIFSVYDKVRDGNRLITDARAVRICLAHHYFTIIEEDASWSIQFINDPEGPDFDKIFSEQEFLAFVNDFDLLYKSQIMLVYLLTGMSNLKNYLVD
ncbi:MAG: hypothetical protein GWN01_10250 [Nitrosopumilaceae archaeon]|nr:hypothetical protein [Nitrosopumilaceae archaeon]NIU01282.1 hypothetical protein [Nitrosopumilaceae archaeon]NIU87630.1 hypothetical protein [Nitrosopumilaceae archaeon]NIV66055.1 hypothetical protein [Nitrosopumilaceae archaeon]NIX61884.1 hypothetical protein [Nitrosopumilaceae archaeon]